MLQQDQDQSADGESVDQQGKDQQFSIADIEEVLTDGATASI